MLGKRDDGYHDLETVFQTVSLCDQLTFTEADSLTVSFSDPALNETSDNTVLRAARLLGKMMAPKLGASIFVEKNIPSPGGLGGGSSNAAAALIGLCRLWEIEPPFFQLNSIAASIGADVPFFLHGGTAIGTGTGIEIEELADIDEPYMMIVTPDVAVSTAAAFGSLNARNLTTEEGQSILLNCRFQAEGSRLQPSDIENDFENTIFSQYPEIRLAYQSLLDLGARARRT